MNIRFQMICLSTVVKQEPSILSTVTVKAEKAKEAEKRKASAIEDEYKEAKKKLKMLEEEAGACLKQADKKAKESLKNHDLKLLAQSVALRDKGNAMMNTDVKNSQVLCKNLKTD